MMALLLLAAGALGRGASHPHPPPPPPIAPPPGFKPCYENASLASLPFCTPTLPAARRAADLVGRMTLAEKFGQLLNNRGEAIPRLGAEPRFPPPTHCQSPFDGVLTAPAEQE